MLLKTMKIACEMTNLASEMVQIVFENVGCRFLLLEALLRLRHVRFSLHDL